MTRLLVVSDKPLVTELLKPHIERESHGRLVYIIHSMEFGAARFRYPRGLAWHDFPNVGKARYGLDPHHSWKPQICDAGSWSRFSGADIPSVVQGAGEILFCCECSPRGAAAFENSLDVVTGSPAWRSQRGLRALRLENLQSAEAIKHAWERKGRWPDHIGDLVQPARAKRYFDYNFNVNALSILGRTVQLCGLDQEHVRLSKFGIQVLFAIRRLEGMTKAHWLHRMHHWPGTGRYQEAHLGTSHVALVAELVHSGLLSDEDGKLRTTPASLRLLQALHPDCEDPDFPNRLAGWIEAGLEQSRTAMDRYLRTYFGKQKKFVDSLAVSSE